MGSRNSIHLLIYLPTVSLLNLNNFNNVVTDIEFIDEAGLFVLLASPIF